jgi:DNA invertase Pin-like site-specific DNA recombinase
MLNSFLTLWEVNMKFGYARTSKLEQNLDLQIDELKKAGCEKIITDKISGSVAERPGLGKLKEQLRPKDVIVVWRLDRLGR